MFKIQADEADFALASYNFALPETLIAQIPSPHRGEDSLYVLDRANPQAEADSIVNFADLPMLLPPNSLLIANNSKVARARIISTRPSGGAMEVLLLSPPPLIEAQAVQADGEMRSRAQALLRPAKKIKINERYTLYPGLDMRVIAKHDFGQAEIELFWQNSKQNTASHNCKEEKGSIDEENSGLGELIAQAGQLPLPPYIKRRPSAQDAERYQTVYADSGKTGSLAAPTAGLHFTPKIKEALKKAGHDWAELTLFVGYGTFSPVRTADIRQHQMHAEYVELEAETVQKILEAKAQGRPVIAVGTTSARVLEAIAAELANADPANQAAQTTQTAPNGKPLLAPKKGWVNCFIYPGTTLRVIDGLITNFHLPESTLLMLVSALTGRKRLLAAYERAIKRQLRFFSYGDAMLIK